PDYDDEDGNYDITYPRVLENFKLDGLLGGGGFCRVAKGVEVNKEARQAVAIKISQLGQESRAAAKRELRVLKALEMNDKKYHERFTRLRDFFEFGGHIFIVMDLLDQSIYDFLKDNNFIPFPDSHIQSFAQQIFSSIKYLHDHGLIHVDIKPKNILLHNKQFTISPCSSKLKSSFVSRGRYIVERRVLLSTEIRLIDFGFTVFENEHQTHCLATMQYCAPEAMLFLKWSFPRDIWSIGCTLVELFTGKALFDTVEKIWPSYVAMMEIVTGSRIVEWMYPVIDKKHREMFTFLIAAAVGLRSKSIKVKHIDEIIPKNNDFRAGFADLVKKALVLDPDKRITAEEALNHSCLRESAQSDSDCDL
ncbi:cmgc clk protein kinase, partial [Fusarium langsethiae]